MTACGVVLRLRTKINMMVTATITPPVIPPTMAGVFDLREGERAGGTEGATDRDGGLDDNDDMVDVDGTAKVGETTKPGLLK
jgi:hypothetical protein